MSVVGGEIIDPWLLTHLVCPRDHQGLTLVAGDLICASGHRYPIVDGIPVMLLDDVRHTISLASDSLRQAARPALPADESRGLYLDSLGISDEEKRGVIELAARGSAIDPVVAYLVAATNGLMYKHLIGQLDGYPIPGLPLPAGHGRWLLDVGCSWGRWSIAAARLGYRPVGIDPSLGAVMAARRVSRELGLPNKYLVADARHLPFPPALFDVTYSYSVLQHMQRADVAASIAEMGRVLTPGGTAKVQMPIQFGIRCLYHQARRGFREGSGFDVRYWTIPALTRLFTRHVGATRIDVDCFFGIGLQASDEPLMPPRLRRVLRASERLKAASHSFRPLVWMADSVFVEAIRPS